MVLALLVLITALSISAVAIYYSVAGLVAIFAAAALPIMIMGGVLEVAKLVTAVWLHRYWKEATWWLKTYLSTAVIVLMLITSMGIFGFLSKAHIEQTSASAESIARIEQIDSEIARQNALVDRAENQIRQLESSGTGSDTNIQSQIDKEQERIDSAYSRIQPAINEQNKIIENVTALFQQELTRIDNELAQLQGYIDTGEIAKAQAMVGAKADGRFGPKTAAAFTAWQDAKRAERVEWLQKIQDAAQSPTVIAARDEISRLRKSAEDQVANSQQLIERLRSQLAQADKAAEIDTLIDEQQARIKTANQEIDTLVEEKYSLEADYRKLEAEVGPIKYIAEFIYGETADKNMLEEAVRWVIIVIIFVFDPLAVLLLIASQYTFELNRKRKDDQKESLRQEPSWEEYEQARAQRIVDNPGFTVDSSAPSSNDDQFDMFSKEETNEAREETREEATQDVEELRTGQDEESLPPETGNDSDVAETSQEERSIDEFLEEANRDLYEEIEREEDVQEHTTPTNDDLGNLLSKDDIAKSYIPDAGMEQSEVQVDEGQPKKVGDIPDTRNAMFYPEELENKNNNSYIVVEDGKQVRKYRQNEEQNENSLWNRINRNKE